LNAEILTVGAEILCGDILDTNARDLSVALRGLGIPVTHRQTLPDDEAAIAEGVRQAVARASVVFVTGGLGPTPDDRTRGGVAKGLDLDLRVRPELVEVLRARYLSYGHREMPDINLVQVTLPEGAEPIPNLIGTAPGFRIETPASVLFAVPGVPREMRRMLADTILPWLTSNRPVRALRSSTLKTIGIGESELVERFGEVFRTLEAVDLAFYPQMPGVHLKLTAEASGVEEAGLQLARAAEILRRHLGDFVYGAAEDDLAAVTGELLAAKGWSLGTAESCTGGSLAGYLTSAPGASRYYQRGVVAYADRVKVELLGVPQELIARHGAVSEPVVRAMAEGLRTRAGLDVVVAVTGIAGPTGGTDEKPVGLVHTAIAAPDGTRAWRSTHPGTREMVVARTVLTDVNRLRLVLLGRR
jgi:nicotinamide-nucleotide amidase